MKLRALLSVIIFTFLFSNLAFSQDEDSTYHHHENWKRWTKSFDVFQGIKGRPTISLDYGMSKINLRNSVYNFADANMAELKLGYTRERTNIDDENIIDYKYRYFVLSYAASDFLKDKKTNYQDLDSKMWRAGFLKSNGYGYKLGNAGLVLYNTSGFIWSRVDVTIPPPFVSFIGNPPNTDYIEIKNFNKSIRFGTSAEGGIRFMANRLLTFDAGYERSIIFPRHLFWKWLGSFLIEGAAQSMVDRFVDEIFDTSPQFAPVVSFVLKNALSYGIYQLRQEKMNWPFNTVAPLSYNQVKLGMTFVF